MPPSARPNARTTDIVVVVTKDVAVARAATARMSFRTVCQGMVSSDYAKGYLHGKPEKGRMYLIAHARKHLGQAVDHRTLAFAVVQLQSDHRGGKEMYVEVICSRPGNGAKMLGSVEELAFTMGCSRVKLEPVDSAVGFYKKVGYVWGEGNTNPNYDPMNENEENSSYFMTKRVKTPLRPNRAKNLNAPGFAVLRSYVANSRSYSHDTHRKSGGSPAKQAYAAGLPGQGKGKPVTGKTKPPTGKGKPVYGKGKPVQKKPPTAAERAARRWALTNTNSNSGSNRSTSSLSKPSR